MLRTGSSLAVALLLLAAASVSAGTPTDRLRDFFAAVDAVLADPALREDPLEAIARVRRLVAEFSDIRAAAATALGREWPARSPAEREEFTALFAELLERAYVGRLAGTARISGGVAVSYLHETLAGDGATVAIALGARDGHDALVEFRMGARDGRWLVRDVVLDGVSVVGNYHAQFRRLLRQGSYGEVVRRLRAKLGEKSLMFARAAPATVDAVETAPPSVETPRRDVADPVRSAALAP